MIISHAPAAGCQAPAAGPLPVAPGSGPSAMGRRAWAIGHWPPATSRAACGEFLAVHQQRFPNRLLQTLVISHTSKSCHIGRVTIHGRHTIHGRLTATRKFTIHDSRQPRHHGSSSGHDSWITIHGPGRQVTIHGHGKIWGQIITPAKVRNLNWASLAQRGVLLGWYTLESCRNSES